MFIPNDIHERSTNTKIQYSILMTIYIFFQIFLLIGGFAFLYNYFGFGEAIPMEEVINWSVITLVLTIGLIWYRIKEEKEKKLKLLKEAEETIAEIRKEFERKSKKDYVQGKSPVLKKLVEVEFLGTTRTVSVGIIPIPGIPEEDLIRETLGQELMSKEFGIDPNKEIDISFESPDAEPKEPA